MNASDPTLSPTGQLAAQLVRRASITPDDAGCQPLLLEQLEGSGFQGEYLRFGDVSNLWVRRGETAPLFVFAGHTDVVPTGGDEKWGHPPFAGDIVGDILHGRGAADMKGSLAAMATACQRFVKQHPEHRGSIALLITSDEEGPARDGTVRVLDTLADRNVRIDWCVVGEPTSQNRLGDTIKNGRRGSLNGTLVVSGIQGHVAYPHLADNPIHRTANIVAVLEKQRWDDGNANFPPTTFQISNIQSGTGATNVIPSETKVMFNFRFSPESSVKSLKSRVETLCQASGADYTIYWSLSGLPYQTGEGELIGAVIGAVESVTNDPPSLSTDGGTSDGRFIAPTGAQVIELGPINRTIHRIDEQVNLHDLDLLSEIYENMLIRLLS